MNKISKFTSISLVANIVLIVMLFNKTSPSITSSPQPRPVIPADLQAEISKYPFLSKRIFTEKQNDILINFTPLSSALQEYASTLPNSVGVYFEYLPSGTSVGVNEHLETNLASLIKIPLVMGVYREIEKGAVKKEDVLTMKEKHIDKRFGNLWKKGVGTKLTVKEAMDFALIYSDNTAANMLFSVVPPTTIDNVFDSLNVPKDKEGKYHIISPKNYSSILRSLYLSSYLKRESSNEILGTLTKTIFNDKIAAEIPTSTKVSHKIGVFKSADDPNETYSDCGIFYVPERPYMLCVMTKSSEEKAREYMSHISKMIYGYIGAVKAKE